MKKIVAFFLSVCVVVCGLSVFDCRYAEAKKFVKMPGNPVVTSEVSEWDTVWFGNYKQDEKDATGLMYVKSPIKWRVLSVNGNKALLLSDRILNISTYYYVYSNCSWEGSTARCWLNGYYKTDGKYDYTKFNFINDAFSEEEQKALIADSYNDKVSIMNVEDATNEKYGFLSDKEVSGRRGVETTGYLKKEVGYVYNSSTKYEYWLRIDNMITNYKGVYVNSAGRIVGNYCNVDNQFALRPTIILDLSSDKWSYAGTVDSKGNVKEIKPGESPLLPIGAKIEICNEESYLAFEVTKESAEVKLVEVQTDGKTVTVPDKVKTDYEEFVVTGIDKAAFSNAKYCKNVVTTIKLNDYIKKIPKGTFNGLKKLKSITLGKSVTDIGEKAFYKCTSLTSIKIPSKVKNIGKSAFEGCSKLKTVTIQTKLLTNKTVGKNAFKKISSKAVVKVPAKKLAAYKELLKAKGITGAKQKIKK